MFIFLWLFYMNTISKEHCLSQALEKDMTTLQSNVGKVLEASKLLIGQMKPQSAPLIKSETRLLSRDHVQLGKALSEIRTQVQVRTKQFFQLLNTHYYLV